MSREREEEKKEITGATASRGGLKKGAQGSRQSRLGLGEKELAERASKKVSRLTEPEVADDDDKLADEAGPEGSGRHRRALDAVAERPVRGVGEDGAGTDSVRRRLSGDHDGGGSDD